MLKNVTAQGVFEGSAGRTLASSSPSPTLSVVASLAKLAELENKWRELETNSQRHVSVFQSFDWCYSWAQSYVGAKDQPQLHVLAGYHQDELVFLWPLMRTKRHGISILTWLTEPFGQYGDVICKKGHDIKQWIDGAVAFLLRLNDIDILRLRHVRADSNFLARKELKLYNANVHEKAPFLDLTQFADEEAYDQRYTPVQRKRRKKIRKALEHIGPLAFERLPAGTTANFAIAMAIQEKNKWLADRGRMNVVLGCPGHLDFLRTLSAKLGGSVETVVTQMKAGDKPVSWEVGFRHNGIHYGYITSHLNALTDLSPARLHMDQSQRLALKAGLQRFDLMVPNDAHKESWSSAAVNTEDYFLPISTLGAIYGHVYLRLVRPVIRKLYYRLEGTRLRKFYVNPFGKKPIKNSAES